MILREYQNRIIQDVVKALGRHSQRILVVLPTGGGKTVIASQLIKNAQEGGWRSLFLCNTREILWQTIDKIEKFNVEVYPMIHGEPYNPTSNCIVSSIQTMHSWVVRRKKENIPPVNLVITDEADGISSSKTWQDIHALYPNAIHIGFTATPINDKGQGLAAHYDEMVLGPSIKEGIAEGWLVNPRYYAPSIPDLSKIKITAGDYNKEELQTEMSKPKLVGDIFSNLIKIAPSKQTMVFTAGVRHSIEVAKTANEIGISAAHVDGQMEKSERDAIVEKFRKKEIQLLANCNIFTRGADFPELEVIVNARPTKSLKLYIQIIGRALRPYPGKNEAIIIDHAGAVYEHGLITDDFDWKLYYNDDEIKKIKKEREKKVKRKITCVKCHTVFERTVICPSCGWRFERNGKPVPTIEAYLKELDEEEMLKSKKASDGLTEREWYLQLKGFATKKGFSDNWASWTYKNRFGKWPSGSWKREAHIYPSKQVSAYGYERLNAYKLEKRRT